MNKKKIIKKFDKINDIFIYILAFIGLLVSIIFVHEFTHIVEILIHHGIVLDYCFLGYTKNSIGWVGYSSDIFVNETLATLIQLLFISSLVLFFLTYLFLKKK